MINFCFVTGAPRSGTTYLGLELSKGFRSGYIHEPFNKDCSYKGMPNRDFFYPEGAELEEFHKSVKLILSKKSKLNTGYFKNDTFLQRNIKRLVGSRGPYYYKIFKINKYIRNVVIKDPIGVFLTTELMQHHPIKTVAIYRDPVEFVGSTMKLGWSFNAIDLIQSKADLLREYGGWEFANRLQTCSNKIECATLTWCTINSFILGVKKQFPDTTFLVAQSKLRQDPSTVLKHTRKFIEFDDPPATKPEIIFHEGFNKLSSSIVGVQKFDDKLNMKSSDLYLTQSEFRFVRKITDKCFSELNTTLHQQDRDFNYT